MQCRAWMPWHMKISWIHTLSCCDQSALLQNSQLRRRFNAQWPSLATLGWKTYCFRSITTTRWASETLPCSLIHGCNDSRLWTGNRVLGWREQRTSAGCSRKNFVTPISNCTMKRVPQMRDDDPFTDLLRMPSWVLSTTSLDMKMRSTRLLQQPKQNPLPTSAHGPLGVQPREVRQGASSAKAKQTSANFPDTGWRIAPSAASRQNVPSTLGASRTGSIRSSFMATNNQTLNLKFQEVSCLSASLFEIILTVSRIGHPTLRAQIETPSKQPDRSGPLHGMDSLMECMFCSPRNSHNGLWGVWRITIRCFVASWKEKAATEFITRVFAFAARSTSLLMTDELKEKAELMTVVKRARSHFQLLSTFAAFAANSNLRSRSATPARWGSVEPNVGILPSIEDGEYLSNQPDRVSQKAQEFKNDQRRPNMHVAVHCEAVM